MGLLIMGLLIIEQTYSVTGLKVLMSMPLITLPIMHYFEMPPIMHFCFIGGMLVNQSTMFMVETDTLGFKQKLAYKTAADYDKEIFDGKFH